MAEGIIVVLSPKTIVDKDSQPLKTGSCKEPAFWHDLALKNISLSDLHSANDSGSNSFTSVPITSFSNKGESANIDFFLLVNPVHCPAL